MPKQQNKKANMKAITPAFSISLLIPFPISYIHFYIRNIINAF